MGNIIYLVTSTDKETGRVVSQRLIDIGSKDKAEKFVINETVTAERAKVREATELAKKGILVETPGEEGE